MSDELTMQIHNLCIRYHQMRLAENTVRLFDDRNHDERKKVRDILVEALEADSKLFDEQLKLVENLIDKQHEN